MSAASPFFGGTISRNYEDYLGPFVFEPYASDLASRIGWTGVGQVLELACGSGRLTAHIAQRLPAEVAFTATDVSDDMISVARAKVASDRVVWSQADMMALPFPDSAFDMAVCQFGLMLVPDPSKALAEIYRALKPGGKVLFSTWTDLAYNRLWAIGDEVVRSFTGKSPMRWNPGPFMLDEPGVVLDMLRRTGFVDPLVTTVANTGAIDSAEDAARGFIYGLPVALLIQKEQPAAMLAIIKTFEERLKAELGDRPLRVPQKALVFEGRKA